MQMLKSNDDAPLPWTSPEYVSLMRDIGEAPQGDRGTHRGDEEVPRDVYQDLMRREKRVLDTVDRVVNDSRKTAASSSGIAAMPFRDMLRKAMATGRVVLDDLVDARSISDVQHALLDDDRKIFVGGGLVAVAVAAALINAFA